ncbi:hypothetical protein KSP39_PZI016046 [Platanthera zijinensis]|uniref:Nucleotidyl transferase domain-containing protein n=1 Tax=Platanthera zijinensis TaxID=2320716 RepID=A0AAP0BAS8_9ASPA
MAQKKTHRPSADDPEVERIPLQAVLLADSFAQKFRPITLERPKVLLPLVNAPMIDYALAWLESVGVDEVFVFCCAHSQQVKSYLENSQWTKQPGVFSVATIESHDAISAGDALRVIHEHGVENKENKKEKNRMAYSPHNLKSLPLSFFLHALLIEHILRLYTCLQAEEPESKLDIAVVPLHEAVKWFLENRYYG